MTPGFNVPKEPEALSKLEAVKNADDIGKADFFTKAQLASAAAWSPNPVNAPLYIDLPVKNGATTTYGRSKMDSQYAIGNHRSIHSEYQTTACNCFDAGNKDEPIATGIRNAG